ncbi:hypothetical protein [Mucilaginibacter sp. SG564]|uniref:DUF7674 family protein n=1 Tax=unclassified Mucilaginibacter TaxID=2617802 RepID=UPI001551E9F5|nr:hypothetical protein [Mucilaginibacter sp. SG564]NOW99178.1 tRNA A37 threonylcarbamoyltransferase TsaD [Mucilaginibacter sp. SG564]
MATVDGAELNGQTPIVTSGAPTTVVTSAIASVPLVVYRTSKHTPKQQMSDKISEKEFVNLLVNKFPEISEEVLDEDYEGLLTLQVSCFKRFTQESINNNDLQRVSLSFDFVNQMIDKVVQKVENALYISYLGHLIIPKGSNVEKMLPHKLKKAYEDIHKYNSSQSQNSKLNKFLEDL